MNLRQQTLSNVKWSLVESISLKALSFVLAIILARLLTPKDFGILAVVNVFYLLVETFIDGGLKEALIQKKEATEDDYSTVFWTNLAIAILLYLLLFSAAPFIEAFYGFDNLSIYIRLQAITLIIVSLTITQVVKANREMALKKVTISRVPANLTGFGIGIGMAYTGFGIYSLIAQQLVSQSVFALLLFKNNKFIPKRAYNVDSIKSMYGFGLKVFLAGYINRIYVQSLNLVFAKVYTPELLGFYTKSKNLLNHPTQIIVNSVVSGTYPTFVKLHEDNHKLKNFYRQSLEIVFLAIACLIFPLLFIGDKIIVLLLGEQWAEMAPYLKVVSISFLLLPFGSLNRNILKAKAKAGLYLKIELISKGVTLAVILPFLSQPFFILIQAFIAMRIIATIVEMAIIGRLIRYNLYSQIADISSIVVFNFLASYLLVYLLNFLSLNNLTFVNLFFCTYLLSTLLYLRVWNKSLWNQLKTNFKF